MNKDLFDAFLSSIYSMNPIGEGENRPYAVHSALGKALRVAREGGTPSPALTT